MAVAAYNRLFEQLYSLTYDEAGQPISLPLTAEAQTLFIAFHDAHCREAEDPSLPASLRAFYAKLKGVCGRLALIHAVCVDPATREIGAESVGAAADLVEYFKGQAARVAPLFRSAPRRSPLERAEREILKNLIAGAVLTKRDLQRLGNAPAAVFNQALAALVEVGRVRKAMKPGKRKNQEAFALASDDAV